jgi:hypothetical protein
MPVYTALKPRRRPSKSQKTSCLAFVASALTIYEICPWLCRGLRRLPSHRGGGSLLTPGVNAGATCLLKHIAVRFQLNAHTYHRGFKCKSTDNYSSGEQQRSSNSQLARLTLYRKFARQQFLRTKNRKKSQSHTALMSIIDHSVFCAVRS